MFLVENMSFPEWSWSALLCWNFAEGIQWPTLRLAFHLFRHSNCCNSGMQYDYKSLKELLSPCITSKTPEVMPYRRFSKWSTHIFDCSMQRPRFCPLVVKTRYIGWVQTEATCSLLVVSFKFVSWTMYFFEAWQSLHSTWQTSQSWLHIHVYHHIQDWDFTLFNCSAYSFTVLSWSDDRGMLPFVCNARAKVLKYRTIVHSPFCLEIIFVINCASGSF